MEWNKEEMSIRDREERRCKELMNGFGLVCVAFVLICVVFD